MHKSFGERKNTRYKDRLGAYLIAINERKVAVVRTPKGLFLPGGGLAEGETDEEAISRECMEETGYRVMIHKYVCSAESYIEHPQIGYFHPIQAYYLGKLLSKECEPIEPDHQLEWIEYDKLKGKLFPEMQNWALDICWDIWREHTLIKTAKKKVKKWINH